MVHLKISTLFLLSLIYTQYNGSINGVASMTVDDTVDNKIAVNTLSNGITFPLVGLGVGSSQSFMLPLLVTEAMKEGKNTFLFDTSSKSANEQILSNSIVSGGRELGTVDEKITIHVVTKVWYTHLGYERTVLSVQNSIENFKTAFNSKDVDLKLHVLLHWPRCYDNIHFMDCEGEEKKLPEKVKSASPSPHTDRENAWKQSWKALEDMYLSQEYAVESIGVSNFQLNDMKQFELFATVQPHIVQVNVWSMLYDPEIIMYCNTHNIQIQVYNVMNLVSTGSEKALNAKKSIEEVANHLSNGLSITLTVAQVVQAWLIQHGVSVIPKTAKFDRLYENSAVSLAKIPEMSKEQAETVAHAVASFLNGQDLPDFNDIATTQAKTNKALNGTTFVEDSAKTLFEAGRKDFEEQYIHNKFVARETVTL